MYPCRCNAVTFVFKFQFLVHFPFPANSQSGESGTDFWRLSDLFYVELTISLLIGRKRTVNFRNQRLGHHLAADYTIIMSRTLKVTGNHVMYDRGA